MGGAIEWGYSVEVLEISVEEGLQIKLHVRNCIMFILSFPYTNIKNVKMNDQTVIGLSRTQEAKKSLNGTATSTRKSPNNAVKRATCVSINDWQQGFFFRLAHEHKHKHKHNHKHKQDVYLLYDVEAHDSVGYLVDNAFTAWWSCRF